MNARPVTELPLPTHAAPVGRTSGGGQCVTDTHNGSAPAPFCPADHHRPDTQTPTVGGATSPTRPTGASTPRGRSAGWDHLRFFGDTLDDLMRTRIAISHRALRATVDRDELEGTLALLEASEADAKLKLKRAFRRTAPEIRAWTLATPGLGEPLMARLLGAIGDPVWATPSRWMAEAPEGHDCDPDRCGARHLVALEPFQRTPGQLLSYCGHGASLRRTKGMTKDEAMALGNPRAKMLTHLIAESCMKCVASEKRRGSPYRLVYDAGRAKYADREDWTPKHQHNAAIRLVGKAVLIDLWRVAVGQEPHHPA